MNILYEDRPYHQQELFISVTLLIILPSSAIQGPHSVTNRKRQLNGSRIVNSSRVVLSPTHMRTCGVGIVN